MNSHLYSPHKAVVPQAKRLRFNDFFILFFSFGIGLSVMQTGTVLAIGGGSLSFLSIILGSVVGTGLLAFIGSFSSSSGLSSMANLRSSFGSLGIIFPSFFNIIQLFGWCSFGIVIIRDSVIFLLKSQGVTNTLLLSPILWSIIMGSLATLLAMSGPLSVIRLFLKKFAVWFVLGASLWLTFHLFSIANFQTILHTPSHNMGLGTGFDLVVSLAFSYLPVVGDYTRFGSSPKRSFWGVFVGYTLGSLWLLCLGASYTLLSPSNADVHTLIAHLCLVGAGVPLFLLIINETDTLFVDIHSSSVSLALFSKKLSIRLLSFLIGGFCILISILVDLSAYVDFILLISSVFSPLFGIVIGDFILLRGQIHHNPRSSVKSSMEALIIWLIGILLFFAFRHSFIGGALPSLFCTVILRMVSRKFFLHFSE